MTSQTVDAVKDKTTPCYVSYLTFVNMLDYIKSLKVMPTRIDNSVWAGKFNGSNAVLLTAGLRYLKLLEGDKPTEQFRSLAFAEPEERKGLLKEVLTGAYGAEMTNLSDKTPNMVDEELLRLGATASTRRKANSFFVQAAKGAGIEMPSIISKRARNRPSKKVAGSAKANTGDTPTEDISNPDMPKGTAVNKQAEGPTKVVALHGATVALTVTASNLIELATHPDELNWVQQMVAKFADGEKLTKITPLGSA